MNDGVRIGVENSKPFCKYLAVSGWFLFLRALVPKCFVVGFGGSHSGYVILGIGTI